MLMMIGLPFGMVEICALGVPLAVAALSFRRAALSRTRNWFNYCAVAIVAMAILDVNALFFSDFPPELLSIAGVFTLVIWVVLRDHCDQRRRHWADRRAEHVKSRY